MILALFHFFCRRYLSSSIFYRWWIISSTIIGSIPIAIIYIYIYIYICVCVCVSLSIHTHTYTHTHTHTYVHTIVDDTCLLSFFHRRYVSRIADPTLTPIIPGHVWSAGMLKVWSGQSYLDPFFFLSPEKRSRKKKQACTAVCFSFRGRGARDMCGFESRV